MTRIAKSDDELGLFTCSVCGDKIPDHRAYRRMDVVYCDQHLSTSPTLDEFLPKFRKDDNHWWALASGDHLNLFEDAIERMVAAETALRRIQHLNSATSGYGNDRANRRITDEALDTEVGCLLDGAEDELLGICPYFTGDAERKGAALDAIREVQSMLIPRLAALEAVVNAARFDPDCWGNGWMSAEKGACTESNLCPPCTLDASIRAYDAV